ncbi:MAG TPA: hypothetical protein VH394_20730, partial [Thermoanaerobaculia bacterium]|nr:hypothetical protein [Thermoanaerobaculia bacterium]
MSHTFSARAGSTQFGSFHYALGLIEFTLSEPAQEFMQAIIRRTEPPPAEGDPVQMAYEVTSLFHEMRHFFDTFGTMAGLSLFSGRLQRLKEFVSISEALREAGSHWRLPLAEWAAEEDCPQMVRDFVRRARGFHTGADLYIAPFTPLEIDGHRDDLMIELEYEQGGTADAFPLRVGRIGADGKPRPRTVLFPLGLETLLEGNAHALSRTLVERYFPASVAEELQQRTATIAALDDQGKGEQRAAQTSAPYMVCDLLITRYMRLHGVETFPRNLVLAAIDKALATSSIRSEEIAPGATALVADRLGSRLVDVLEAEDPATLAVGAMSEDARMTRIYQGLLAAFEAGGDWQSVKDDLSPASSIAIWEAYMAKTFIVPLLRKRLATGSRAFRTYSGFLELLQEVGLPPARVGNGALMLAIMPGRVQQAWWHQLMLGEIAWQLVRGGSSVFCPRAHAT